MEYIKAKIEFIKTLFLVFVATLFSMVGYFFIHFSELSELKKFFLVYGIIFLFVINSFLIIKWFQEIKKIKDGQ